MIALRAALVAILYATVAIAATVPGSGALSTPAASPGLGGECYNFVGTVSLNPPQGYTV
ncbi:hypothetical protein BD779DRAFT_1672731 [Infundibulicybe gibba]|nr:hypothetical protein BD779DRAFT_1672731 [Infundibulicybe gibba]